MDFIQYWGYDIQGAVYQEVVYRNTGKRLPFFIAAASKEKETDIELIWIDDEHLHEKLIEVEQNTPKILALKSGAVYLLGHALVSVHTASAVDPSSSNRVMVTFLL